MEKVFIILLSLFIIYVKSDDPQTCRTPTKWESRYIEYNQKLKFYLNGNLSYDGDNKRERIVYFFDLAWFGAKYDAIFLHSQNVSYIYSFKTGKCYKRPIKREWKDFGVPTEAKFLRKSYLGSASVPNAGLLTNIFSGKIQTSKGNVVNYIGRWTAEGCLPVWNFYMSKTYGTTSTNFMDITPGIADDKIFVPRDVCLNDPSQDIDEADVEVNKYF